MAASQHAITASEVHVPGRPTDPAGVKALAVAAHKSFSALPSRRHARACRLDHPRAGPDGRAIFARSLQQGVWLAKAGFGAVKTPFDYAPMIAAGESSRHDHNRPYRRVVYSRIQRHPR